MKATDLMIGDWVRYSPKSISLNNNYGGLYRAEGISQDTISLGAKNYRFVVSDKEIDSIPLTPEILEKNGFEMFKYDGWVHYYRIFGNSVIPFVLHSMIGGEMLSQEVDIFSTSTNTNRGIDVNYVHELQHALRLCGLNELADNFKV